MIRHRRSCFVVCLAVVALGIMPGFSRAAEVVRYLPTDSEVVVQVNLRQVLDADLVKMYFLEQIKTQLKPSAELQTLLTAVGLDPLRDISSITLAAAGKISTDSALVIVRGKFDPGKFHKAASDFAAKNPDTLAIHKSGHGPLYEGKDDKDDGSSRVFATFLDKGTLVLSPSRKQVVDAVEKNGNKQPAALNKNLQTLLGQLDGKQTVWVAALASKELKAELAKNPQTKNLADKLQTLSGGIAVAEDIKAEVRIQTSDAKAALEIRRLLEGVKAILILAATGSEEYGALLADIVSGIKIRSDKGIVRLEATVTAEQIGKGLKKEAKR